MLNVILFNARLIMKQCDSTQKTSTDMSFCVIFSSFFPIRMTSCSWSVFIVYVQKVRT